MISKKNNKKLRRYQKTKSVNYKSLPLNNELKSIVQAKHTMIQSGPLPDPQTLEQYNSIVPDAAERIIKMAEEQAKNRQSIDIIKIKTIRFSQIFGVIAAFIISMTAMIGGFILILTGHSVSGWISILSGVSPLIAVFIGDYNKNKH
ncbi:DUF2335 domain-containing protein [Fructilactobacillus sp. Tb1]|uniref:DUF2335 domain-containing protein n=1 Tax=Fructilactobacillus sp. Tb1 TaxID=3422304 RepID=UPI003D292B66